LSANVRASQQIHRSSSSILEGELFFGAAPELDRYLQELRQRIEDDDVKFAVFAAQAGPPPDVVCIEHIEQFLREETERGVTVLLAGVRPDTLGLLKNVGFESWFPQSMSSPKKKWNTQRHSKRFGMPTTSLPR